MYIGSAKKRPYLIRIARNYQNYRDHLIYYFKLLISNAYATDVLSFLLTAVVIGMFSLSDNASIDSGVSDDRGTDEGLVTRLSS